MFIEGGAFPLTFFLNASCNGTLVQATFVFLTVADDIFLWLNIVTVPWLYANKRVLYFQHMTDTANDFFADIVTVPYYYDHFYFILQCWRFHVHDFRTLAANFQRENLQKLMEVEAEASKSGY